MINPIIINTTKNAMAPLGLKFLSNCSSALWGLRGRSVLITSMGIFLVEGKSIFACTPNK